MPKCAKCSRELVKEGSGQMAMYDGVVCTSCRKITCVNCQGSPVDKPCKFCGGAVQPAFEMFVR